jgi:hypothetical protein
MRDSEERLKFAMDSGGLNSEIFQISLTASRVWHRFRTARAYRESNRKEIERIPPAQASNRRRGAHRCPFSARRRRRAPSRSTLSTPSRPPLQQQRTDSTDHKHHPVAGGGSNNSRHIYKQNKRRNIQIGGEVRHPKRSGGRRRRGRSRRVCGQRRRSRRSRPSRWRNSHPALASPT